MSLSKNNEILEKINPETLKHVQAALEEDMPQGDLTSSLLGLQEVKGHARFVAKQDLVFSGADFIHAAFLLVNHNINFQWHFADGEEALEGQTILEMEGNFIDFLKSERVALNYAGRFSGIATLTKAFVDKVKHTDCKILDTRKTTPLFRNFEKRAVIDGGANNHRMSLSDAVMLKENHILASGSITKAVELIRKRFQGPIEVECTNLKEVLEAVKINVSRVMLDNMTNEQMAECLKNIPDNVETEASGNMNLQRVQSVAELGVDFISIGALTHSAKCADISLLFDWKL